MKALKYIPFFLITACSQTRISDGTASIKLNNLGSHTRIAELRAGNIHVIGFDDNAAESFSGFVVQARKAWNSYLLAAGIKYIAGKYYDNQNAELGAGKAVELEKLRNAKSAAESAASIEKLKITTEAEAFVQP